MKRLTFEFLERLLHSNRFGEIGRIKAQIVLLIHSELTNEQRLEFSEAYKRMCTVFTLENNMLSNHFLTEYDSVCEELKKKCFNKTKLENLVDRMLNLQGDIITDIAKIQ